MKIRQQHKKYNGKERIILEFTPSTDKLEQKVLRSIASANFGEKIFIKHKPLIELRFITKQKYKNVQPYYPPDDSRPEVVAAKQLASMVDTEEYEAAVRTSIAQNKARSLGIKIPYSLAKKFTCRCGDVFTDPSEFLSHRHLCSVLHGQAKDIIDRGQAILDRDRVIEPEKKIKVKEGFPCRCGHVFPSKRMCASHQKLCSVLKEADEIFGRGKEFIARNRDERTVRKERKSKKERVGKLVDDKATPWNRRGKRIIKKST